MQTEETRQAASRRSSIYHAVSHTPSQVEVGGITPRAKKAECRLSYSRTRSAAVQSAVAVVGTSTMYTDKYILKTVLVVQEWNTAATAPQQLVPGV